MHKNVKGALAKTLIAAMAITMAGVQAPDSSAAKKPALSTKKVTIEVKKSKKVTVKNVKAKKVKKLTVKSSAKKIATVKKKGKTAFTITGKKAGKAKITAKITLKGKKKAVSLKANVTVKNAAPKPTVVPKASSTPTTTPQAPPAGTPTATPVATPDDPAEPNAGEKRIKHSSNIADPIISNVTIWGLRDNPYLTTGYDYSQFGTFSGLFSKWYEAKDNFKLLHELFTSETTQSLNSMKLMEDETPDTEGSEGSEGSLYTIGETGTSVKSILPTGKLTWDTKEYSDTAQNSVDFYARSSTENTKVTVVDGNTLDTTADSGEPAVAVSGREQNWHGIEIDITDYLKDESGEYAAKDYQIALDVRHEAGFKHNGESFYAQIKYMDENGAEVNDYPVILQEPITSGNWKSFNAVYSAKGMSYPKVYMIINWYGNQQGSFDDFYIKNVKISEIVSDKQDGSEETLAYSPLWKNTEQDFGFSIGGVMSNTSFKEESYKKVINQHFSSMTIDNDLKLYGLLDQDKTIESGVPVLRKDFSGEHMVKWAYENGIGVRGHTIVCDSNMDTNCKYFFYEDYDTTKKLASREVMLERMRSIIKQTITYFEEKYPGTIHTWDVVNEAIVPSDADRDDPRKIQRTHNLFYDTIGSDYVEYSFLYAREAVDELKAKYPHRDIKIKLFYNDFGCYTKDKRNAICALAKSIMEFGNEKGKGNLIDGVGMQCYLGGPNNTFFDKNEKVLQPSKNGAVDSIPNAVFLFNELGLDVQFTELTVHNYDESKNAAQAAYYEKVMQMVIDINNGTMQPLLTLEDVFE